MKYFSHVQSHWVTTEVYWNHETFKFPHSFTPNQSDYAWDEHGDDKSMFSLCPPCWCKCLLDNSQAGILEEMMDDTLAMYEDEELEEEADAEVD